MAAMAQAGILGAHCFFYPQIMQISQIFTVPRRLVSDWTRACGKAAMLSDLCGYRGVIPTAPTTDPLPSWSGLTRPPQANGAAAQRLCAFSPLRPQEVVGGMNRADP